MPLFGLSGVPKCDKDGICHCNMVRAAGTTTNRRPPQASESSCVCKNEQGSASVSEYAVVYEDKGGKYCVCYSSFKD